MDFPEFWLADQGDIRGQRAPIAGWIALFVWCSAELLGVMMTVFLSGRRSS